MEVGETGGRLASVDLPTAPELSLREPVPRPSLVGMNELPPQPETAAADSAPPTAPGLPPALERALELARGLLGRAGVEGSVQLERHGRDVLVQILSEEDKARLTPGRLEDIQYLINRLLHREFPTVPRIRVDLDHRRVQDEADFLAEVKAKIDEAATTAKPIQLRPLNSYHRRLVHNLIALDDRVSSWSPRSEDRLKQITIMPVRH